VQQVGKEPTDAGEDNMRLMLACIVILILTAGCSCFKQSSSIPAVIDTVVIEDYKIRHDTIIIQETNPIINIIDSTKFEISPFVSLIDTLLEGQAKRIRARFTMKAPDSAKFDFNISSEDTTKIRREYKFITNERIIEKSMQWYEYIAVILICLIIGLFLGYILGKIK